MSIRTAQGRSDGQPKSSWLKVVADPADRLCDEQRGRRRVKERRNVAADPVHPPDAGERAERDSAPDAKPALPDGERPPPVIESVARRGQKEVQAPPGQPGRNPPQLNVVAQLARAALRLPPATDDRHRREDSGGVAQAVDVKRVRTEIQHVAGRTGN